MREMGDGGAAPLPRGPANAGSGGTGGGGGTSGGGRPPRQLRFAAAVAERVVYRLDSRLLRMGADASLLRWEHEGPAPPPPLHARRADSPRSVVPDAAPLRADWEDPHAHNWGFIPIPLHQARDDSWNGWDAASVMGGPSPSGAAAPVQRNSGPDAAGLPPLLSPLLPRGPPSPAPLMPPRDLQSVEAGSEVEGNTLQGSAVLALRGLTLVQIQESISSDAAVRLSGVLQFGSSALRS